MSRFLRMLCAPTTRFPQAPWALRRQAYRKLALAKHPDRGGDPEEFARLSRAYEVRWVRGLMVGSCLVNDGLMMVA